MIRKRGQLWHKRWHGHALNGTQGLTLEEQGAYTRLLDTMYDQGGPVRDNGWNLCAVLGVDPRPAKRLRAALIKAGKLVAVTDPDGAEWLVNDRVQTELKLPTSAGLRADFGAKSALAIADGTPSERKKGKQDSEPASPAKAKSAPRRKRKEERTPTPSGFGVSEAVEVWNEAAFRSSLPRCAGLSDKRKAAIAARLAVHGPDGWRKAVEAVERSRFCNGENERRWKASIDYLASPSGFLKSYEGQWAADREATTPAVVVDMDDVWRDRLARYHESGGRFWRTADWGPRPGDDGCRIPAALLNDGRKAA